MDQADIVDADGMSIVFASWLFNKKPLAERVATTDFVLDASRMAEAHGIRFFFLGAVEGVAQAAATNLQKLCQNLQIVGIRNGYFTEAQEAEICDEINRSGADVLWVGMGSPIQEGFAVRNRERLKNLTWIRTCGGLFDHWSGKFRRAPVWMQRAGLEWVWRAAQEPRRLGKRYLQTNHIAIFHLLTKTNDKPHDRRRADRVFDQVRSTRARLLLELKGRNLCGICQSQPTALKAKSACSWLRQPADIGFSFPASVRPSRIRMRFT